MKDRKFLALSSFFFLLFAVAMSLSLLSKPTSSLLRAKNVAPSPLKSFVVVFPQIGALTTDENQGTKIKVSVFVRDVNGSVLSGRSIRLSSPTESISVQPADTQTTDDIGKAQFFVSAKTSGKVQLQATDIGSNTQIVNVPTIEFTE